MDKKRKATKAQRERINSMLKSGLIDRDESQEIIEKPRAGRDKQEGRFAFWEKQFPGRGRAIMDLIDGCYDWEPQLKSALPDIEDRLHAAIPSREVRSVRIFRRSEAILLQSALRTDLSDEIFTFKGRRLTRLEEELQSLCINPLYPLMRSHGSWIANLLQSSLCNAIEYAVDSVRRNDSDAMAMAKLRLALWFDGNFPLGFDKKGNLLVLVAD